MIKIFSKKKKSVVTVEQFNERLVDAIDKAKFNYEKAKMSEDALFESDLDARLIRAQTNLAKQKYFYLLRIARQRQMTGHWQQAFARPEK